MTISASHITDQLMQASGSPPIQLSEHRNAQNEPICTTVGEWRKDPSTALRVTDIVSGRCPRLLQKERPRIRVDSRLRGNDRLGGRAQREKVACPKSLKNRCILPINRRTGVLRPAITPPQALRKVIEYGSGDLDGFGDGGRCYRSCLCIGGG